MFPETLKRSVSNSFIFYPFIFLLFFVFLYLSPLSGMMEADTYFHLALSRMTATQGLVRTVPQLENIGWASFFADKEFLFHQYTGLAYHIGGDTGVLISCQMLAASILMTMVLVSSNFCSKPTALLLTLLSILNINFVYRIVLVRPHLMGILFSLVILEGLIKKRKWPLAIGALLFPLAYHAFYIPLMFMGAFLLVDKFKNWKFISLFGVLPIVVGLIINPYFPGNIVLSYMCLKIALAMNGATYVGLDTKSYGFMRSMDGVGPYLVLLGAILYWTREMMKQNKDLAALLIISITLSILYFYSPRTLEYFIPAFAVTAAASYAFFRERIQGFLTLLCLFLLAISIRYVGAFSVRSIIVNQRSEDMLDLVRKLPSDKARKVFNCEWENGAYILYARPNLKFVDLLDPNFIFLHDPALAREKESILLRPQETTFKFLTEVFKADYLMCFNPYVNKYLSENPRYKILAVGKTSPQTVLYEIIK